MYIGWGRRPKWQLIRISYTQNYFWFQTALEKITYYTISDWNVLWSDKFQNKITSGQSMSRPLCRDSCTQTFFLVHAFRAPDAHAGPLGVDLIRSGSGLKPQFDIIVIALVCEKSVLIFGVTSLGFWGDVWGGGGFNFWGEVHRKWVVDLFENSIFQEMPKYSWALLFSPPCVCFFYWWELWCHQVTYSLF